MHGVLTFAFVVNQFAHIEASRLHAWFCESNIAKLTIELAASFESMAKALSVYFKLDVPSDEELVRQMDQKIFLDREMYEKILFNLCKRYKSTNADIVRFMLFSNQLVVF